MTPVKRAPPKAFKRALLFSLILHVLLVVFLAASGALNRPQKKGMIHYVNFIGFPGGGSGGPGGGGGGTGAGTGGPGAARIGSEELTTTPAPPPAKKESLRDLTIPEKAAPEPKSSLRYPTDKPKKTETKKAAITKPEARKPSAASDQSQATAAAGVSSGGYGLRFGTGSGGGSGGGTGGGGFGSGYGDPFGAESFPFTYYLQMVSDKISANWFTSLSDPGLTGQFETHVYFRIFRNGQVSDLKIEVSSLVEAFDLSALRAIQTAGPFPPLPAEYNGQYLGIHLIFEHAK